MIVIGVVLLILGFLFHIGIVWTLGIILAAVGLVLLLVGAAGHSFGGRSHYW